ncbi:DUF362 domain-containing protein [Oscillatoria amoena NRMC-F 0135]|nr:DUF362 domain-containing protein [Oscillatoria amoena NRMC-F 0135]
MARDASSVVQFVYNPDVISAMTDRAIGSFFGAASAAAAFGKLVSPTDVVGLKVFSTPGAVKATNKAIVRTVINALKAAGVPAGNIIVWDKFRFDLETAHFLPTFQLEEKIPVMATAPDAGYGDEPFYDFEVTGTLIWGDRDFNAKKASADINADGTGNLQLSTKSYFSRLVTQRCTKLINLPSLCDHPDFGINGALVNMAIGSVDNSRRFGVRPYFGVPPIPDIYSNPAINNKVILTVMDALITTYAGGPSFRADFSAQTGQIFVATDPVAIDSLCLRQVINLRKTGSNIPTPPWFGVHVEAAAEYGLGVADPKKINLSTV